MLRTNDPRHVRKYIHRTKKLALKHKCLQNMKTLHAIPREQFTTVHQQEYEKLLQLITMTKNLRYVYRG